MNILKYNSDEIIDLFKNAILNKNTELEYIYGNNNININKLQFLNIVKYCNENYKKLNNSINLDIRSGNNQYKNISYNDVRITIDNLESIKTYCKKEKLDEDINFYAMIKNSSKSTNIKSFNYRINLKYEEIIDNDDSRVIDMLNDWNNISKYYRYKKRLSYITNDGLFRIDLTGIKSNSYNKKIDAYNLYKTFKDSNILNQEETYELEIEYVGNNYKINSIFNIINFIDFIKNGNEYGYKNDNIYIPNDISTTVVKNPINEIEEDIFSDDLYELIEPDLSDNILNKIYESLNNTVYNLLKIIENKDIIQTQDETYEIIKEYYKLTKQNLKSNKKVLVGPQPINLNFHNLTDNLENSLSIYKNYVVTEKADGERYLLYINKDKEGYLLNKKSLLKYQYYELINTGYIFPDVTGEWLLDGEYVTKTKDNADIKLFLIFDVYYENSEKSYNYNFISKTKSRQSILNNFENILENKIVNTKYKKFIENYIDIKNKQYLEGDKLVDPDNKLYEKNKIKILKNKSILKKSKEILDNESTYLYKIDGLIYLPMDLPVGATYTNNEPPEFITGTWNLNYKWKPEIENTIDFKVNIVTERVNNFVREKIFQYEETNTNGDITIGLYKKIILKVIYDEYKDDNIDFCMKTLNGNFSKDKKGKNMIDYITFNPDPNKIIGQCNIKLNDKKLLCINNEEIKQGDIVEMRYDSNAKNNMFWIPIRLRKDKLGKSQADWVARRIWDTIENPIKDNYIKGIEKVPTNLYNELEINNYYMDEEFTSSPSESLRKLHNYIKSKLISGICLSSDLPKEKYVLDTSIGRGGDLKKYMFDKLNIKFLLGLDISPIEKACKRYYFSKNNKFKAVFMQYDTSKNIKNGEGIETPDNIYNLQLLNILFDKKEEILPQYQLINKRYNNKATNGFNVISCQFTLHYYFKNEATLRGYLQNLAENCKKNGYFIGCCYNGMNIFNKFNELKKNVFEYKLKGSKLPIYSIIKEYDINNFDFNPDDTSNMLGNSIKVYMDSIGSFIEEYLVNFDYFTYMMNEYGFEPVLPDINKQYSNILTNSIGSFKEIIDNLNTLKKTDVSLQNPKIYKQALDILDNKDLIELSSMNNYFIYKKVN